MSLHALTLQEPWAWAILRAGKTVENRSWRMPDRLVGVRVALHASKTYDHDGASWIRSELGIEVPTPSELALGAITGLVRFGESFRPAKTLDRWTFGPWCFPVLESRPLKVRPACRGALGFWLVPPEVATLLKEAET